MTMVYSVDVTQQHQQNPDRAWLLCWLEDANSMTQNCAMQTLTADQAYNCVLSSRLLNMCYMNVYYCVFVCRGA